MIRENEQVVFVVDDDEAVRESISMLVETVGLKAVGYERARRFFEEYDPERPGCLILDWRLPEMDGLHVLKELARRGIKLPVIMITAYADVPMAVKAIKDGVFDFIEKPFNQQQLLNTVQRALRFDARQRADQQRVDDFRNSLQRLTNREHEVMELVAQGMSSSKIAAELGIERKTVDFHRYNLFQKLKVKSAVNLVLLIDEGKSPQTAQPLLNATH